MDSVIPSASEVSAALKSLTHAQMRQLAAESGVPFTTLWKVRAEETTNPGIDTVNKFFGLINTVKAPEATQAGT